MNSKICIAPATRQEGMIDLRERLNSVEPSRSPAKKQLSDEQSIGAAIGSSCIVERRFDIRLRENRQARPNKTTADTPASK